ncbi:hypothetical protein HK102_009151, partial [Quaeritorhiza haematococci]
ESDVGAHLEELFSLPLETLPTQPLAKNGVTTNLISREVTKSALAKVQTKHYQKRLMNPIDYTPIKKKDIAAQNQLPPPAPYSPLPERLPALKRIVLRVWAESAIQNKSILLPAIMSLTAISGIRADPLFADRGDAARKIREGMPLGARVELTGRHMYDFLDKMIQCVLPRLREWDGVNPLGDGRGVITFKLPAAAVGYFPDIEPHFDMYPMLLDMEVVMETTGQSDQEAVWLLSGFQVPFLERVEREVVKKKEDDDPWAKFRKRDRKKGKK